MSKTTILKAKILISQQWMKRSTESVAYLSFRSQTAIDLAPFIGETKDAVIEVKLN
jgi:hypothetical protein